MAIPAILKGDTSASIVLSIASGYDYTGCTLTVWFNGVRKDFTGLVAGGTKSLKYTAEETAGMPLGTGHATLTLMNAHGVVRTMPWVRIRVTDIPSEIYDRQIDIDPSQLDVPDATAGDSLAAVKAKLNAVMAFLRGGASCVAFFVGLSCFGELCPTNTLNDVPGDTTISNLVFASGVQPGGGGGGGGVDANTVRVIVNTEVGGTNALVHYNYLSFTNDFLRTTDNVAWGNVTNHPSFVTESVTNGLAPRDWVTGLGYVTEDVTNGLATASALEGVRGTASEAKAIAQSAESGLATKMNVGGGSFLGPVEFKYGATFSDSPISVGSTASFGGDITVNANVALVNRDSNGKWRYTSEGGHDAPWNAGVQGWKVENGPPVYLRYEGSNMWVYYAEGTAQGTAYAPPSATTLFDGMWVQVDAPGAGVGRALTIGGTNVIDAIAAKTTSNEVENIVSARPRLVALTGDVVTATNLPEAAGMATHIATTNFVGTYVAEHGGGGGGGSFDVGALNATNMNAYLTDSAKTNGSIVGRVYQLEQIPAPTWWDLELTKSESIPASAYRSAFNLRSVSSAPGATVSIGNMAFSYLPNLRNVSLQTCSSIAGDAFYGTCISSLIVSNGLTETAGEYGVFGLKTEFKCDIPSLTKLSVNSFRGSDVVEIGDLPNCANVEWYSCYGCTKLKKVGAMTNCTSIGMFAFSRCLNLKTIDTSHCVSIAQNAFENTNIDKADLSNVETLGNNAFNLCTNMKSVVSVKKITDLGQWVFNECTSLTNLEFEAVTKIGIAGIRKCYSLKSVTGLDNLMSVGSYAFELTPVELLDFGSKSKTDVESISGFTNFPEGIGCTFRCNGVDYYRSGSSLVAK